MAMETTVLEKRHRLYDIGYIRLDEIRLFYNRMTLDRWEEVCAQFSVQLHLFSTYLQPDGKLVKQAWIRGTDLDALRTLAGCTARDGAMPMIALLDAT